MESPIRLRLPANELEELIDKAIDWAFLHGLCMRPRANFSKNSIQFFPLILIPSPFPRKEFDNACRIQTTLNILIHRVAQDYDFLCETLGETIRVDDFTKRLFEIYETVRNEGGPAQKLSLGILRSDLMLDTSCAKICSKTDTEKLYCCCKQVEINTIASGCGGIGPLTVEMHRYLLREIGYDKELENLPENNALQTICSSIIDAWKMYGNEQAVVLFVIEDVTYNICDQRMHEFEIRKQNPDVKVVRRNLTQLSASAKLGYQRELIVENYVVSVVYYRAGYEPAHYPTEKEWETRLLIERSLAIKCPTIQYHLAGTKKVQQVLARPGIVCRFLEDEETCIEIRKIFTGLYALDFDEDGEAAIEMAIAHPDKFVLKPQREGGSNNKYGVEIKNFLESVRNQTERVAWILMNKIYPPIHNGYMIRPEDRARGELQPLVSELGIFGVIIADDENVYINKESGYMLRTKSSTADEAGVSAGLGACDSPILI